MKDRKCDFHGQIITLTTKLVGKCLRLEYIDIISLRKCNQQYFAI